MLFNSYIFVFLFLPATLLVYFLAARSGRRSRLGVLLFASFVFYSWWDVQFVPLLMFSILGNYVVGQMLTAAVTKKQPRRAHVLLSLGVTLNLLVLAAFKYANFFVQNIDGVAHTHFVLVHIILPLGISFFTFEQVGYLIDIKRGHIYAAEFLSYAVFVSFFPRLVAGPILRFSELEPQLTKESGTKPSAENLAVGLSIFFVGLSKKAFLADGIAPHVGPTFAAAGAGYPIDFFLAWGGVLAYTCQLYFDFSGYSDMAIGAARCFGITFPLNFASPYKAGNIIEFWRRWHMTLSRFLRDYLYISLGGNRRGTARRYANLLITMLLGGLWHGANWTFVCWGLHGAYLVINHGWHVVTEQSGMLTRLRASSVWRIGAHILTFLAIVVAWVFFRSPDFSSAGHVLAGMAGAGGATLPNALAGVLRPAQSVLAHLGVSFGIGSGANFVATYCWTAALLLIAFTMPNTQELLARFHPNLPAGFEDSRSALCGRWSLTRGWALLAGALTFIGVIAITHQSEFLYWQF